MSKKTKQKIILIIIVFLISLFFMNIRVKADDTVQITFKDEKLFNYIRYKYGAVGVDQGTLTLTLNNDTVNSIVVLDLSTESGITDLTGVEKMKNIYEIHLDGNTISSYEVLKELPNLITITANKCGISDVTPFKDMSALNYLYLDENNIKDISNLQGLKNLLSLSLKSNQIEDISVVSNFNKLVNLYTSNNSIKDISSVSGLTELVTFITEKSVTRNNNNLIFFIFKHLLFSVNYNLFLFVSQSS